MATKPLYLYNPVDGETYTINLNEEDYERAQTDMEFAQGLLFHGVVTPSVTIETTDVEYRTLRVVTKQEPAEEEDRHVWQYNATVALIASMETHMEDLNHPLKRKHVYANVANDVNSAGHAVNAAMCQGKWKSLVRSYKAAADNKQKTGRGPTRFNFYNEMDALLGEKPNTSCSHTLDTSNPTTILEDLATPSPSSSVEHNYSNSHTTLSVAGSQQRKRKHSTAAADDLRFLQQKEEAEKNKERRHQERLEISRAKLALEERKIALLEKLINK